MLSVSGVRPSTTTNPPRTAGLAAGAGSMGAGAVADDCATVAESAGGRTVAVLALPSLASDTFPPLVSVTPGAGRERSVLAAPTPATPTSAATDANPKTFIRIC